jgi:hypothetical protein
MVTPAAKRDWRSFAFGVRVERAAGNYLRLSYGVGDTQLGPWCSGVLARTLVLFEPNGAQPGLTVKRERKRKCPGRTHFCIEAFTLIRHAQSRGSGLVQWRGNAHHVVNGLGCRGNAAEIKPIEPVWVIPRSFSVGYSKALTVLAARV